MPDAISTETTSAGTFPISVILPTYNRSDVLPRCLQHLEQQTFARFEVIIVDDGSTDATPQILQRIAASSQLHIRHVRQPNRGPAAARNHAISLATAPISLIIGDDILASPTFIETHLRFHQQNPQPNIAALGLTRWDETLQAVTPFMRWLDNGFQFDYNRLLAGLPPDYHHFYTSNLSLKTVLLRRHPFDERFRKALMEDAELGYRLTHTEDLRIVFLREAVAGHVHPMDFNKSCARAFEIGRHSALLADCCPGMPPPQHGRLYSILRRLLCRLPWLKTPLRASVGALTRFWCPNPFLGPTLDFFSELGRRHQP